MSKPEPADETSKFNPIAGCSIFVVIILMISFLTIMFVWQGNEHEDAIHAITEETEKPTTIASEEAQGPPEELKEKLTAFSTSVRAKKLTKLSLDADELNLFIAQHERLESLRGRLYITEITDEVIHADICFPVRADASFGAFVKSLFSDESEGKMRYLNGTMTMEPEIVQGSIFPRILTITPNNKHAVPKKYIREFPTFLFSEYRNDESIADVLHEMDDVQLVAGTLSITSDPKQSSKDTDVSQEAYDDKLISAVALFGLFVFIFVTSILFMRWAKKKRS